jgi:hypothetical protein
MVLAAWLTGLVFVRQAGTRRDERLGGISRAWVTTFMRAAVVLVWIATLWAAATFGEIGDRINASGVLVGPTGVRDRMREATRLVRMRPVDWYAPVGSTGIRGLTRYVLDCTRPSDRLLAGAFEPQIFFYAERGFAGGQVYLRAGWHGSREDQLLTIDRMRHQSVPLAIFSVPTIEEIKRGFPLVYAYVQEEYVEAARSGFGEEREYVVLVRRGLQAHDGGTSQLSCYR